MNNTADTADTTAVGSYKDGFGDFFFEPFEKWSTPTITEDMSEEEKQDVMGITGSNAVPIVELDGFQRYAFILPSLNTKINKTDWQFFFQNRAIPLCQTPMGNS